MGRGSASNSSCHRRAIDDVTADGAEAVELGGIAEVAALGPHGGEEPPAKPVGVVARGREGRGGDGGVRADRRNHKVKAHVVLAQIEDRGDLGRQRGGGVTVDRFTGGGDRRVVLDRAPIDLVRRRRRGARRPGRWPAPRTGS